LRAASASAAAATADGIPCACCCLVVVASKIARFTHHDLSHCQRRLDQTSWAECPVHSLGGVDRAAERGPARAEELDGAAARGVGTERARRSAVESLRPR
jgi:hypothetical protein